MGHIFFSRSALLLAALLPVTAAQAQFENIPGTAGKGLGSIAGQSFTSSSLGNVTGLLQYCVTNNYLSGQGINSIQEKLTNKLPGGSKSQDPGYNDGLKGILHSGSGKKLDLGGGNMQDQIKRQVCDTVLSQAQSML